MKGKVNLFKKLRSLIAFVLIMYTFTFFIEPATLFAAQMSDYCLVPPYVKKDVSVNILIIMDNSLDMEGQAYTSAYSSTTKYVGTFDPTGCYQYSSTGHNNRWYRTSNATTYTCSGATEFPGNVLNWATMSKLSVLKKVLVGGNLQPQVQYDPNYIVPEGGGWAAVTTGGCTYSVSTASKLTTSGASCPELFSGGSVASLDIDINYAGPGTTNPYEAVSGILQTLVDSNKDLSPDTNAPRLGLIMWQQKTSKDPSIAQCLPFGTTLQSFLNSVAGGAAVNNSPLANATTLATQYYLGTTTCGTKDPFNSCASWEPSCAASPPPCRNSFVIMLSTGSDVTHTTTPTNWAPYTPAASCNTSAIYPGSYCTTDMDSCSLVKNACYGATTDLRSGTTGKQIYNTYVVHTFGSTTSVNILKATAYAGDGKYYSAGEGDIEEKINEALQAIIKRAAAGTAASVLASGEGSGANLIQAVFYPRRKFLNSATGTYDEVAWIGTLTNFWYYVDPLFSSSAIYEDNASSGYLNLTNDNKVTLYFDSTNEKTMALRNYDTNADGTPDGTRTPDIEFEKLTSLWEGGKVLWSRDISASPRKIYTPLNTSVDLTNSANEFSTANVSTLRPFLNTDNASRTAAQNDAVANNLINYMLGTDQSEYSDAVGTESYRSRTVKVDLNGDGDTLDQVDLNGDGDTTDSGEDETVARVWKLGDILNSTPKISSWLPLNSYNKTYKDSEYGIEGQDAALGAAADNTHFITKSAYKNRGLVFAGGNDGMLHAFRLGRLEVSWSGQGTHEKARLLRTCLLNPSTTCTTDANCSAAGDRCPQLGEEMWAFIPKNALPYLNYLKNNGYCHVYTIDLTPYVFDASIGRDTSVSQPAECVAAIDAADSSKGYWRCIRTEDSWKTILIGGMRYGGACRNSTGSCANDGIGTTDCVKTPLADVGYSSYFALDITDQNVPKLLWEFSDPALGFATTGPAVVKIKARKPASPATSSIADDDKNGRWFVIFGSGPTGGNTGSPDYQFLGRSDQNLKLFVLDLKTGQLETGTNPPTTTAPIDTTIPFGFAGSMLSSTHDADLDYQDDVIYVPYVKREGTSPNYTWTSGGVGRLLTKEDLTGTDLSVRGGCVAQSTALNPNCWAWSTVMDGVGAVTSATVRLQNQNTKKLWLYFGTGRYYYEKGSETDDPESQRYLIAIKDPCFSDGAFDVACTTSKGLADLGSVDLATTAGASDLTNGWKIALDLCTTSSEASISCSDATAYYRAERVITDPLATSSGVVFFTTYKPYKDQCSLGGKSFIWATKYDSGAAAGTLLKGKALIQVSTGSIEQMDMSSAFTEKGGRRTSAIEGVPPTAQGLSIVSTPPALKRVLHIRQR